jgi:hypothetical protein
VYRLASHCGIWNVYGLLARITPEQVDEWMAFDELEPLGLRRVEDMIALHGFNSAALAGRDLPLQHWYPPEVQDEILSDEGEPESAAVMQAKLRQIGS